MGIHILDIVLSCFINKLNSLIDWHPLHFPSFLRLKSTLLFSAINNMNFQSAARHRKELKMLHTIAAIWHTRHCRSEGRVGSDVTRYSFFFPVAPIAFPYPTDLNPKEEAPRGPCKEEDWFVLELMCGLRTWFAILWTHMETRAGPSAPVPWQCWYSIPSSLLDSAPTSSQPEWHYSPLISSFVPKPHSSDYYKSSPNFQSMLICV